LPPLPPNGYGMPPSPSETVLKAARDDRSGEAACYRQATKALLTPSQTATGSIRSQARRRAGPGTAPDAMSRH
jgi:hypothetical protein